LKTSGVVGLFFKRIGAWAIDLVFFISVVTVLQTLINLFYPNNYIPAKGMQLFTPRQMNVFFISMGSALVLMLLYLRISYFTNSGQTLGHKVFGLKLMSLDREELTKKQKNKLIFVAVLRFLILFVPGPMVAFFGGGLASSVFVLMWGVLLVLPIPYKGRTAKATIWQHIAGYRFVDKKTLKTF